VRQRTRPAAANEAGSWGAVAAATGALAGAQAARSRERHREGGVGSYAKASPVGDRTWSAKKEGGGGE